MSTWQIFSDAGRNFRWEVSGQILDTKPQSVESNGSLVEPNGFDPSLPSFADLLQQGCSKLLEMGDEGAGNVPMFRTGLGKSVALKQSSIAKALSVLRVDDSGVDGNNIGGAFGGDSGHGFSNSLFSTGSGKSVNVSSAGLIKAKALLGMEEDNEDFDFQALRESCAVNNECRRQSLFDSVMKDDVKNGGSVDNVLAIERPSLVSKSDMVGGKSTNGVSPNLLQSEMSNSALKPPPIKFNTASGRSISVSTNALQRARSLLGDPDLGTLIVKNDALEPSVSVFRESRFDASSNKENDFYSGFTHPMAAKSKQMSKTFISPLKSSSSKIMSSFSSSKIISGTSLMEKFDEAVDGKACGFNSSVHSVQKPFTNVSFENSFVEDVSCAYGIGSKTIPITRSAHRPLDEISNTVGTSLTNNKRGSCEKRRLGRGTSVSPFKRPRSSKFTAPLSRNISCNSRGSSQLSENSSCRRVVSSKYPFCVPRKYIKEYFGVPFVEVSKLGHITGEVRSINSGNAVKYTFSDEAGVHCVGAEDFYHMLLQSGASVRVLSKEWVNNHYKWIVWKLACYERYRPMKSAAKFLTISNVLEELKYRYEREVNQGHRSAIKRILEGEMAPSTMLVLCISAIYSSFEHAIETHPGKLNESESSNAAKVELTDGWYSVDAVLDESLSKHLATGKLFVGQKLRMWGAGLHGWVGPVSPLEASRTITLLLHINGTHRAHWSDRLGLCKSIGVPLAFRCIKSNGGPVPRTLIGITRLYPVLFKEKLSNGGSIVRTERMEAKRSQFYNQRCSAVMEEITSEFQSGTKNSHVVNENDSEEGAKILKLLEGAAEPEVLMAEMSPEQLSTFASYQAKLEATRQSHMEKAIKRALRDAGLGEREVTPFMRVRVVGLTKGTGITKEGLITIWNPTEKQKNELVEGQAYAISGLLPMNSDAKTLYLQARGSSTKWQLLSPSSIQHFEPFFSPRVSVSLSNLGEVPLCSEFDITAFVVHVGEVYTAAQQKRQWVFVTDGSIFPSQSEETPNALLAISFCSPCIGDDAFSAINYNLAGTTVGFCNLIKKPKDQINHLWIAEATENSIYTLAFDSPKYFHLRTAANTSQSWAKNSRSIVHKLKEKVLFIIGGCKD